MQLAAPEGARALAVFDFLEGEPPGEVIADIGATGAGLAQIHRAGASYRGPDSRYRLDLRHLLHRPLDWLLTAPTLDAQLRSDFQALARRLSERIGAVRGLSQVHCHGDCHGGNNFMTGAEGERVAAFFDFDDAGPGLLAYDLAVFLWSLLLRKGLQQPDADALEKWSAYLRGYRRVQPVAAADLGAVARFVAVRHFWFLGEYASRIPNWGSQTLPRAWLRKQVELFTAWEAMETPAT
ncbi:MAG: phosphotransferase enzyme family protein [Polaromonas sp.]|nr:phosphotransferase enzyme family protein [Polaromonas sp.]